MAHLFYTRRKIKLKTLFITLITLSSYFNTASALIESQQASMNPAVQVQSFQSQTEQNHTAHQVESSQVESSHAKHHSYMGSHGMAVVFGENKTLIAHHMPLFYFPHDYQVVYKIKVNSNSDFEKLLALSSKPLVTILPDNFDLLKLINKTRFSVKAKVYDGHFERGGKPLFDTNVLFEKALYVEPIVTKGQLTNSIMTFDLVSIENNQNLLAIKKISEKPSFDALTWVAKTRAEKAKSITCSHVETGPVLETVQILNEISTCLGNTPVYLETEDFK